MALEAFDRDVVQEHLLELVEKIVAYLDAPDAAKLTEIKNEKAVFDK